MAASVRILCVDDEPNILRALKRIFMEEHYELLTAASGIEGLEVMTTKGPIEVVLSDYRMPVLNGLEFLKKVRQQWPDTIRIVLSGFADFGVVLAAINEGQVYKFIPKPWNDDELKVTVAKAVEVYRLQRRNRQLAEELLQANAALARLHADHAGSIEKGAGRLALQQGVTAQDILYALPAAVVLLDARGQVAYSNRAADALCLPPGATLLDTAGKETLPAGVHELLSRLGEEEQTVAAMLSLPGGTAHAKAVRLRGTEGQDSMLVLIDPLMEQSHG